MDNILLIETATDVCAVAISSDKELTAELVANEPMVHTSRLTLMIEEVAEKAGIRLQELSAVAISHGPGSYTALRVGAATAKGLCFGLDIPLIAVDTLQALSEAMAKKVGAKAEKQLYFPMIDARRMEVYGAVFDEKGEKKVDHQAIILTTAYLENLIPANGTLVLGGNGAEKCKQLSRHSGIIWSGVLSRAAHLLPQAWEAFESQQFAETAYFKPFYLKPPNITKPKPIWK